ncbi:MAG: hypothetical protein WBW90_21695 [Candidatus Acidiferrum sp.]
MSNKRSISTLCQFQFADGRRCAFTTHPEGHGFCLTHFRHTHRAAPPEADLSAELASPAGDFITNIDINHVLGKLFDALAANRISARRATSLAYISALLMQSQEGAKDEARRWPIDYALFRRVMELKYPKNHPKHPKVKPAAPTSAKSPSPKPATATPPKTHARSAPPAPQPPKPENPRPTRVPVLDTSTDDSLPIIYPVPNSCISHTSSGDNILDTQSGLR